MSTQSTQYTNVAITLHWVIAVLIIAQLIGGEIMGQLQPISFRFEIYQLHKSFGIIVLLLSLARLGWRLTHTPPPLPSGMEPWERLVSKTTHILFYVLMIGIPMAGWLMVSASPMNIDTMIFKIIPWPHFPGIPQTEALEAFFKDVHNYMAIAAVVLIVLHVAAALKHHFVNRDAVLTRMIPSLKKRS
ncbi:cytochrome b [Parvularcula sp. IMCC14364]|uniref:cytochrome b n=1 Tax=Parvularcula sp. IMCC14364 TaxID=3067902 RepID=UPI002740B6A0|nr:cytochrome b [Parvularcula sp. IMCC14364]